MDTDTTVRIVLFVLQVFGLVITIVYSATAKSWLGWIPSFGIGECGNDGDCWSNEMVYRTESVCFVVFVFNAILSVSGCTPSTVMGSLPNFTAVVFAPVILAFFPNSMFKLFSSYAATGLSCLFLLVMTLLLVDFGVTMNDMIFSVGISARTRTFNSDYLKAAKITLIATSILLVVGAIGGAIALWIGFSNAWVPVVALVGSLILGFASVIDLCKLNGNLFTSCLVMAYSIWLSYEVLVTDQDSTRPVASKVIGLFIAFATLGASIFGSGLGLGGQEPMLPGGADEGTPSASLFTAQALVHASASLYILTVLAPPQSTFGFVCRVIALILSLLLYAAILVAPKVCPSRF